MFRQSAHLFLTFATVLAVSQMFGGLSYTWLSNRWTRTIFLSTLGQVVALAVVGHLHWVASSGANDSSLDTSALVRAFALALWSLAAAAGMARWPTLLARRALGILGVISFGCLVCLLLPATPWSVLPPFADGGARSSAALEPADLCTLALYAGSTGFAVPFATAIAALFENNSDNSWARHTFGWAFAVWAWLSLAMVLAIGLPASHWRVVPTETWELVKSAAGAEWLASSALMYLLLPTTRWSTGGGWALLLATVLFPVAYLGILLVPIRIAAGTVSAYALDPMGDLFALVLVRVLLGGALMLYAWRLAMRGMV
jgi:cytochrome c biogenesis factor